MAFEDGTLVRIGDANTDAGQLWMYGEDATVAAIVAANYFDNAYPDYGIEDADVMIINGNDGFVIVSIDITAGAVTVASTVTPV